MSLFERLASALDIRPIDDAGELRLRRSHVWDVLLAAAIARVEAYRADFEHELGEFRDQPGLRLSIELPRDGVSRSRSSRGPRWIVDEGHRVFGDFKAYTLRRRSEAPLRVSIGGRAVLDQTTIPGRRTVTAVIPAAPTVTADGRSLDLQEGETVSFDTLELRAEGVILPSMRGAASLSERIRCGS